MRKHILLSFMLLFIQYIFYAFILLEFDVSKWNLGTRVSFIVSLSFFQVVLNIILSHYDEDYDK